MPVTDFPVQGGDEKVSLSNTQYRVFRDIPYLEDLRNNWPTIWSRGGNILGNLQYRRLIRVVARESGDPDTPTEERAIRLREAWASRHYGDFRLAGVVAQLKWFVVGRRGAAHMRNVIEAEKARINAAKEKAMQVRQVDMGVTVALVKEILSAEEPTELVKLLLSAAAEVAMGEGDSMAAVVSALEPVIASLGGEEEPEEEMQPEEESAPMEEPEPEAKAFAWLTPQKPAPKAEKGAIPAWAQKEAARGLTRRAPVAIGTITEGETRLMVATSSDVDRYGDVVEVETVILDEWKRSPVLLYGHQSSDPTNHIGTAKGITRKKVQGTDGKERMAVVFEPDFDTDGTAGVDDNPKAKLAARQYAKGMLRTCSIGFIPDWTQTQRRADLPKGHRHAGSSGLLFRGARIIECSMLPVPANPHAEAVES